MSRLSKKIKLIIFDFDGTLVDTKKLYYNSIHKWLKKEEVRFSEKKFRKFFGLKLAEILKKLKVKKSSEKIKRGVYEDVFSDLNKIKVVKDIGQIKKFKVKKIIVSNTSSELVDRVLKKHKLKKYFDEVYGGDKFHHKEIFIKNYLKKNKLKGKEVFYVADMVRDVKIARKIGCVSVIIANKISWSKKRELLKAEPDFILKSLADIKI